VKPFFYGEKDKDARYALMDMSVIVDRAGDPTRDPHAERQRHDFQAFEQCCISLQNDVLYFSDLDQGIMWQIWTESESAGASPNDVAASSNGIRDNGIYYVCGAIGAQTR
jgi:hypothetical protein